jgi:hypothetical protein
LRPFLLIIAIAIFSTSGTDEEAGPPAHLP